MIVERGRRAELLCFMVVTAAASHSLTNEWRVDHVVESCRLWLKRNAVKMPWLERVNLGQLALRLAKRDLIKAKVVIRQSHVQALFTGDMALNLSSTMVQRVLAICSEAIAQSNSGNSGNNGRPFAR